jgi:hypothetical protein
MKESTIRGRCLCGILGVAGLLAAGPAGAQAIRTNPGFDAVDLGPNDDGATAPLPLGFVAQYFGATYTDVYVDNNGYVAFEEVVSLFSRTDFTHKLIAAFFADVDTVPSGSGTVHYGTDVVDGHAAFGVNWPEVGYFQNHADKRDTFQIVLIDRSDTGSGHFDVELNYGAIAWESADDADGGVGGVGGTPSARVGYSDGVSDTLLPGSGIPGSLVDDNMVTGLIHGQLRSGVAGRYLFEFREDATGDAGVADDGGPGSAVAGDAETAAAPASMGPRSAGCTIGQGPTGRGFPVLLLAGSAGVLFRRRRPARRRHAEARAP